MIVTEPGFRDQLHRPAMGTRVAGPAGADHRRQRLILSNKAFVMVDSGVAVTTDATETATDRDHTRDWDRVAAFPVVFADELPSCLVRGAPLKQKPSELAQRDAEHYAPKTHPRIKLRGKMDSLHALNRLSSICYFLQLRMKAGLE